MVWVDNLSNLQMAVILGAFALILVFVEVVVHDTERHG